MLKIEKFTDVCMTGEGSIETRAGWFESLLALTQD